MPGGVGRSTAPREFAVDQDRWTHPLAADPAARVVQHIASVLRAAIDERGWSLRDTAAASQVNRQAIANVLAGVSWPDVVTIVRLEEALGTGLWPGAAGIASRHVDSSHLGKVRGHEGMSAKSVRDV
jgi:ribosome-binding protein aMBF1 (putative translation factor)